MTRRQLVVRSRFKGNHRVADAEWRMGERPLKRSDKGASTSMQQAIVLSLRRAQKPSAHREVPQHRQ